MLNGTLKLHDIKDTEKFARTILDAHLRRTKATLNPTDNDDALAYLVATAWELSLTYQPSRSSSFSKYAYSILTMRTIDWYRQRYYRDQTSTDWYRRANPNANPPTPEEQRNFHFPATLDDTNNTHLEPAQTDHSERDTLGFALRARNSDPLTDCDPDLFNAVKRGHSQTLRSLDIRDPKPRAGTPRRNRRAA
jgi:DNA-directed RNA polymerase specialized sigma24 family protein